MIKRPICEEDIEALKHVFDGDAFKQIVFRPGQSEYDDSIKRWSRAAEKPAGVSIRPRNGDEISRAVEFAGIHNIDLAVKCGGHSTAGASSTNGGMLIDLACMREVRVEVGGQHPLLHVQGGCLWSDVDAAAWEHGLATVGGTVADTGVGGLILGGGYGHLTGSHGLAIDNLVAATVVLASGKIVECSDEVEPDLFWAIRGAGQNFGVVTCFVLRAYKQSSIFAGALAYVPTDENIRRVVTALNDLYERRPGPSGSWTRAGGRCMSVCAIGRHEERTVLLTVHSFNGCELDGRALLRDFYDLGPLDPHGLAMHPYPRVNQLFPTMIGMRSSIKGATFDLPLRPDFVREIRMQFDDFLNARVDGDGLPSVIGFEFYDALRVNECAGGCFAHRGWHMNASIMPLWNEEGNDDEFRSWARRVAKSFKDEKAASKARVASCVDDGASPVDAIYGNYDQHDVDACDIFGPNIRRLRQLKERYDPGNTFNKLFPIQTLE